MCSPVDRGVTRVVVLSTILTMAPALEARDGNGGLGPDAAARAVVAAVNAIAPADIPIDAAHVTATALERLPETLAEVLPFLPADHGRLIEECAQGPIRVRRRLKGFDLVGMIEDGAGRSAEADVVDRFFARRDVDVATGTGVSEGPYPISFDWVVVLDPPSKTLFSFVLNCRD